jgi:hypothetical protein
MLFGAGFRRSTSRCVQAVWLPGEAMAGVAEVGRGLASACLPYEEWVLFRQILMAERDILRAAGRPSEQPVLKAAWRDSSSVACGSGTQSFDRRVQGNNC